MAKGRVIKGGWWWLGVGRCVGDEVDSSAVQIERWAADGLVVPIEEVRTASISPPETAVLNRKRSSPAKRS